MQADISLTLVYTKSAIFSQGKICEIAAGFPLPHFFLAIRPGDSNI